MRYATTSILLLVMSLALTWRASAQEHVYVRIETNIDDAVLFADSALVGTVSTQLLFVPASTERLRLVPETVNTWSIPPISRPLEAEAGDTMDIVLNFPHHYRVESIPFDAAVHIERNGEMEEIGSTPLSFTSDDPIEGNLVIQSPGYVLERVEPGTEVWNRHVIELSPSDELDPANAQVQWTPPKRHRTWIDYAALGTAVAAGALAVHYKFRADDLYADYEQTGDRSLRPDIKSYDVRSGVALGVMQAGIGLFAIRLALR